MMRWEVAKLERLRERRNFQSPQPPIFTHTVSTPNTITSGYVSTLGAGTTTGGNITITSGTSGTSGSTGIVTTTASTSPHWTTTSSATTNIGGITLSGAAGLSTWSYPIQPPPPLNEVPLLTEYRMDGPRSNGAECCISCGRFYNPHVCTEAEDLGEKIEALRMEILSPLENLALVADED